MISKSAGIRWKYGDTLWSKDRNGYIFDKDSIIRYVLGLKIRPSDPNVVNYQVKDEKNGYQKWEFIEDKEDIGWMKIKNLKTGYFLAAESRVDLIVDGNLRIILCIFHLLLYFRYSILTIMRRTSINNFGLAFLGEHLIDK